MLLDEARLSSRIRHPNVVQTLDIVQERDQLCVVMEYVHGVSLTGALDAAALRGVQTPPAVAGAILIGVLNGLHAAHEARGEDGTPLGIVHRDISPQNIVVGIDGIARVLDFGIAKALRKSHITPEGHVKGKIAYMSREQLSGGALTRQADIHAAGVVLWETLVGRRLFAEENEWRLITRVISEEIPLPSTAAPWIDGALDEVVGRAIAVDKRRRYATAQEMAVALAAAVTPASDEEVAQWIERTAGDVLDTRGRMVHDAERFRGSDDVAADDPAADTTDIRWSTQVHAAARHLASRRNVAIIAGFVAVATVAFVRLPRTVVAGASTTSPDSLAPAAITSPPDPSPPIASPVGESRASVVESPRPAGVASAKARTAIVRQPMPVRPPVVDTDCDPPFSIDSAGLKHYKANCLR
jgi:hypothetical protein